MLELLRDPIRLTLALFGAIILMFVMGYGISTDVEDLSFAVLDWDRSEVSSSYVNDISGSRYVIQRNDVRGLPLIGTPNQKTAIERSSIALAIETSTYGTCLPIRNSNRVSGVT